MKFNENEMLFWKKVRKKEERKRSIGREYDNKKSKEEVKRVRMSF